MKKLTIIIFFLFISATIYSAVTNINSNITTNTTWSSGTYLINSNISVSTGITLTIEAGTFVKFENNTRLTVFGYLNATGTDGVRVFFTSKNDNSVGETVTTSSGSPNKGDWNGIYLYGSNTPEGVGNFDYCTIKYGGGTGVSNPANVSNYHGYGHFNNSVSTESASSGYRHIPYATTIQNSTFSSNSSAGILYDCTDGTNTPNISDNVLSNNGDYAAIFTGLTLPVLTNNSGTGNNTNAISVDGNVRNTQTWSTNSNLPINLAGSVAINNGANLTFNSGTLDFGNTYIYGSGAFTLSSGATLILGSSDGISSGTTSGNFRNSGGRTFDTGANYILNASSAQITGSSFPSVANDITFDNSLGITLSNTLTVAGTLNLTSGNIASNSNVLTLGTSASNLGTLNITEGAISGNFQRWFATSTVSDVVFPIGTLSNYREVNISYSIAPTTGGTLLTNFVNNDPGTNGLPISEEGKTISECSTTGYWALTAGSGLSGGNYSLDLTADGFAGITDYTKLRMVKRANSSSNWQFDGTHSATTGSNAMAILHRTGMSGFSNMAVGKEEEPVPVELTSFSASAVEESVILNWQTATEVNNYGFEVQRTPHLIPSREGKERSDRGVFETITFIEGHGNSNSPKEYSFVDTDVSVASTLRQAQHTASLSYRLKQIDTDGSFEYFPNAFGIEVNLNSASEFKLLQNYPNPFNPSTTISYALPYDSKVKVEIFNVLGQRVGVIANGVESAGLHSTLWDAGHLASGIYIIRINATSVSSSNSFTKSMKMLLLK
ncbi:MAG: T9SS type A sorting domain-containing protein [Melioribacteraceae bacterium]|nr:T9SS type A sorting domain-containing protein [Melioribacteraceae bacterium]